jgi:hypothetical protein
MGTDGVITRSDGATPVTDLDAWARWWLAYEWPNALTSDGIWSDPGTYDDGGVWDSGMTPLEISDLRLIPNAWNAAHTQGFITLLQPGSSFIVSPWDLWGDPATWALPDALTIGVE